MPWSAAPIAYSPIRPKSRISNVGHDGTLSIMIFLLILKELKNPYFEAFGGQWSIGPYQSSSGKRNFRLKMKNPKKNTLLASVVNGISCLFWSKIIVNFKML
jgi:hypothetical protein